MPKPVEPEERLRKKRRSTFHRARVRKFLFTSGPHRLSRGLTTRRHLAQDVLVREIEFASALWPAAFDGMRIGHVSDFHLGDLMPLAQALEVVGLLADQQPDLVACTGDVVDLHHDEAPPLLEALAAIDAPFGSLLVLGNHDELHCPDRLSAMANDAGLMLLRNEVLQVAHNGDRLLIGGIDWAKTATQCAKLVDLTCGDETHLLLAHNPKAFPRAAEQRVALCLSGHTHGGQVAMKNRPGANLALTSRFTAGPYERGDSRLFVTAGVGAWFPLRLNCPAEIAIVTMRHDPLGPSNGESPPKRGRRRRRAP
ncbi:MAG: metallophosphoesterase [Planctomycetota bacterium]|jgi:predicted MPP superfamily phosphohydrolase